MVVRALFFALAGTSVAAVHALPMNSVGSPQIKNRSIQTVDISERTVTALRGARGARGSVASVGATGPAGSAGVTGPTGATGSQGETGPAGPAAIQLGWTSTVVLPTVPEVIARIGPYTLKGTCSPIADGVDTTTLISGPAGAKMQILAARAPDDFPPTFRTAGFGLSAGVDQVVDVSRLPQAAGGYVRHVVQVVITSPSGSLTLDYHQFADMRTPPIRRCDLNGIAVFAP